jgi:hypothetical protein
MKGANKILFTVLGVIVVLVVCVVVFVKLFGSSVIKTGIETAAAKTLSVGVHIDDMSLSILGGKVGFQNLIVDNPSGYQHDKLLQVSDARIAVGIGSLLKDTVNIKEIALDNVNVTLEQRGVTSNNLQDIIRSIPKKKKSKDQTQKPGKELHIDSLELTNITVQAKVLPVPGKIDTVTLKLNPIRMKNLGSDEKLDVAELSVKILLAIATGIAEQGVGILPDDLTKGMKTTLEETVKLGESVVGEGMKVLEEGADTGKEIIKGVKDLLGPKKKD